MISCIIRMEIKKSMAEYSQTNRSDRRFRSLLESLNAGVVIHDANTQIVEFNSKALEILGLTKEQITGKTAFDPHWHFIDENHQILSVDEYPVNRVLETGKRLPATLFGICTENCTSVTWVSVSGSPIKNPDGAVEEILISFIDITKRIETQKNLRESEERFRMIFESLPKLSVQGYNKDREVIYWNKASEEIYGYSKEQALGRKLEELIIPDNLKEDVIRDVSNWMDHGLKIPSSELELKRADGTPLPVFSNHIMLETPEGERELYCIDIDLTNLKLTEEKLRENEERYRSIIAVSNTGAWEYNLENEYLWTSPEYFTMLGYSPDDFNYDFETGISVWQQLMHPEDRDSASRRFLDYLSGEMKDPYENYFRMVHRDGSTRWIWSRGQNLKNPDGSPTKIVLGTHIDITKSKNAEEELKQREAYLSSLLKTIPDLTFVLSRDGTYLDYHADESNLLLSPQQFLGKKVSDVMPQEIANLQMEAIEQAISGRKLVEFRYSIPEEDEIHHYNVRVVAFGLERVIAMITDITDSVRNLNQIKELLKKEEEQNLRLVNFTHIVSHNLRTHTANMLGLISLTEMETPEVFEHEYLRLIKESSSHLEETISHLNQVLDINLEMGENMTEIRLKPVLDAIIQNLALQAKRSGVTIRNEIPDDLHVRAVPAYLDSILLNMLTNAIKFRSDQRDSYVRIYQKITGSEVVLSFEDNGLGIDLDRHGSKLFGMYKTFHGKKDSKGLGLFISRYQVEAMGGRIEVSSKPGVGTTFHIYLPL